MANQNYNIATIGCTGHVTGLYTEGFIEMGVQVKVLSRNVDAASRRFREAEIVKGSLYNSDDVARVMTDVDVVFFSSPMGTQNDGNTEIEAAKSIIEGAQKAHLKHLIYVSVMRVKHPDGIGIFEAKYAIEKLLAESGINWTAIRCGSYMEDVFAPRIEAIKKGLFLFPITKKRRFTFTLQSDIPRFVLEQLLKTGLTLNKGFNFVEKKTYSIYEIEKMLTSALKRKVRGIGTIPMYYVLWMLYPYFYFTKHRFSSIMPLLANFNKYGYVSDGETTQDIFPNFEITTLKEYFNRKLKAPQTK